VPLLWGCLLLLLLLLLSGCLPFVLGCGPLIWLVCICVLLATWLLVLLLLLACFVHWPHIGFA
jgi:hypothetical protein